MVDPSLVLFAIDAAIKLGKKTYNVLVDSTEAAPLLLPLGGMVGSIREAEAIEFFDRPENRGLVETGGPYHGLQGPQLVIAYSTVRHINEELGGEGQSGTEAVDLLLNLHKFEQHKQGFGPRSPWQRIAGTVVEIGVDFFLANPQAMSMDSSSRRVVTTFLTGIQDIPFAEGEPLDVVGDTLAAALGVLGDNTALVTRDARIQVLLGGVTGGLRADLLAARTSLGQQQRREDLFKRITASLVRGGAGVIAANAQLFVQGDGRAKEVLRTTLTEMLEGIRDREDLFSTDAVESLFATALSVAAENATLFSDKKIVQTVLGSSLTAMASLPGRDLFSGASLAAIAKAALETVGENAATLIDPTNPQRQLVAEVIAAMAHGLAPELAGARSAKDLLSTTQVINLTQALFREVAKNPEGLLGGSAGDPRRTVLAQMLGSVAGALGEDPRKLVNGTTLVDLLRSTLALTLRNHDKLLDLSTSDPKTNLLYQVMEALAQGVLSGSNPRRLVDREVFVEMATRVLRVLSANVGAQLGPNAATIKEAVVTALQLSTGPLEGRINGENLPYLVEGLLRAALRATLRLEDSKAAQKVARALLQAA